MQVTRRVPFAFFAAFRDLRGPEAHPPLQSRVGHSPDAPPCQVGYQRPKQRRVPVKTLVCPNSSVSDVNVPLIVITAPLAVSEKLNPQPLMGIFVADARTVPHGVLFSSEKF